MKNFSQEAFGLNGSAVPLKFMLLGLMVDRILLMVVGLAILPKVMNLRPNLKPNAGSLTQSDLCKSQTGAMLCELSLF